MHVSEPAFPDPPSRGLNISFCLPTVWVSPFVSQKPDIEQVYVEYCNPMSPQGLAPQVGSSSNRHTKGN